MFKSFEDLDAFKRAYRLSLEIHRHSLDWPKREQRGLGDQMRRSSKSICANVAEGFGKQAVSAKEFNRFLFMAIGSCDEMRVWCRYALDLGHIDEPTWQHWSDEYKEIAMMLQGFSRQVLSRGSES